MKKRPLKDISTKWELYTMQQQAEILTEFRKKLPDDYYCKTTLFEFLNKKLSKEEQRNNRGSTNENETTRKKRN